MGSTFQRISVIDSHTGGEPTRVIVSGGPDLGTGPLSDRVNRFRTDFDHLRSAVVNEPRGSNVLVGAILVPPSDPACAAAVIFFNNVGYLGMCGHGMIGVATTLAHMGKISVGDHRVETPVGTVSVKLHDDGQVSVRNVPSYRLAKSVPVKLPDGSTIHGDVAWGGNWFFICEDHRQDLSPINLERLTAYSWFVRRAMTEQKVNGANGAEIDHVELVGPGTPGKSNARNFVLCPGGAYDRSPCGTGTSAKLACLHADGKLKPGDTWRQESIIGSVFEGSVVVVEGQVIPTIKGSAFITAESTLLIDPNDPCRFGFRGE